MMESIFILTFSFGFILFLLSIYWKSYPLAILTAIWSIITSVNALAVETFLTPVFNTTSGNVEYGTYITSYYGISALSIGITMICLVLAFQYWSERSLEW